MWDDLNVDQLLADVEYETTDTEIQDKNWEETTFTDLELNMQVPSEIEGSAEEEQEISSFSSRSKKQQQSKVDIEIKVTDFNEKPKKSKSPKVNPRKNSRRMHGKTLPANFRSKASESKSLTSSSNKIVPDIQLRLDTGQKNTKININPKLSARNLKLEENKLSLSGDCLLENQIPLPVRPSKSATPVIEHQLRSLAKARSNLHQMLTSDDDNGSIADCGLVIQVLRASLHRESERVNFFRKENEFLVKRYKIEIKHRKLVEQQVRVSKKELNRRSLEVQSIPNLSNAYFDENNSQLDKKENQSASKVLKWCEIPFSEIICESTPYYYSSFAIWFKATWNSISVRLCMVIGNIYRELLTKFRKLSTVIQ